MIDFVPEGIVINVQTLFYFFLQSFPYRYCNSIKILQNKPVIENCTLLTKCHTESLLNGDLDSTIVHLLFFRSQVFSFLTLHQVFLSTNFLNDKARIVPGKF